LGQRFFFLWRIQLVSRHTAENLLDHAVKARTALHQVLVLKGGFCLQRRPGQALQITELEATPAFSIILQAALAEKKIIR
jgi:hypothetical protein